MPKKFPDWKTEEEADAWLQSADLPNTTCRTLNR